MMLPKKCNLLQQNTMKPNYIIRNLRERKSKTPLTKAKKKKKKMLANIKNTYLNSFSKISFKERRSNFNVLVQVVPKLLSIIYSKSLKYKKCCCEVIHQFFFTFWFIIISINPLPIINSSGYYQCNSNSDQEKR